MNRKVSILMLLFAAPLLMGGGFLPPTPEFLATHKISGPAVSAAVVIRPFGGAPPASIRLDKGTQFSGAVFNSARGFGLGCDPVNTLQETINRFVWSEAADNQLRDWIPNDPAGLQGDVLTELFDQLGIVISANMIPIFTDVDKAVCTDDPVSVAPNDYLTFTGVVQFLIPKKKP